MNLQFPYGLYIHIPVCQRRCYYCAFFSVGEAVVDWPSLIRSLLDELRIRKNDFPGIPSTIYLGGGTPSMIPAGLFYPFIMEVADICGFKIGAFNGEFTLEVNPEDITEEKIRIWEKSGINRISMGVQSTNNEELKLIGRRHDYCAIERGYSLLRKKFSNISLDIMFGLPAQSLESVSDTLQTVIDLKPQHISAYSLTYEERTPLLILKEKGTLKENPEDITVEMFRLINSRLKKEGYIQYEISNYAKPGFESHHNRSYWTGLPYLGIGPSAHSFDGQNIRAYNESDIRRYQSEGWSKDFQHVEQLNEEELREEKIMTSLRTSEGLDLESFRSRFGEKSFRQLLKDANPYINSGCLSLSPSSLSLTPEGIMISDEIISTLF